MRRVLVQLAHPVLERSRVNAGLLDGLQGLPGVTVRDLYELYPSLAIDVKAEQAALLEHDVIVFQHPLYWYSVPAILKEWQDLVLEHGWAYGPGGTRLAGKLTLNAITAGAAAQSYRREGANRFTMRELLAPWEQTARLCGMRFLAPFTVHASLLLEGDVEVAPHRDAYARALVALRDETLDLDRAEAAENLAGVIP